MLIFVSASTDLFSGTRLKEIILFLFFPLGVIAGLVRSWFYPLNGSIISLFSLGLFYAVHYYFSGVFPVGPYFILFTIPALLFFAYRYLTLNALSKLQ
jgi:hypothetical protein